MRTGRDVGNDGNPNKVGDFNQLIGMGDSIKLGSMSVRRAVESDVMDLGDQFRVVEILSCFVTAGSATGEFSVVATGSTPATTQVAATHDGAILFAAADAVTEAEVVVRVAEGTVLEFTVAADGTGLVSTLQGSTGRVLIEAEQISGAAIGDKTVVARAAAPSAGEAALTTAGEVQFNAEAANEQVRVKFVEFPTDKSVVDKLQSTVAF